MLIVERPGLLTTVQDLGRYGHERFGVPASGAMDPFALRAANALVGNPAAAAVLEFGFEGGALTLADDGLVAVTGSASAVRVNGRARPLWTALYVRARQTVEIDLASGVWAYLAVRGGVDAPPVLGSRATYLRGGFGGWHGRALRAGDRLPTGPRPDARPLLDLAGRTLPMEHRPAYAERAVVEVVVGPQIEYFTDEAVAAFLSAEYAVLADSDRMGYRLSGPSVAPLRADLISEAMPLGAIQVPAGGGPIVMLADRPTTGGYPKIATAARADAPLIAQCPPGAGRLRFRAVTVAAAQARYRAQVAQLKYIQGPGEAETFI